METTQVNQHPHADHTQLFNTSVVHTSDYHNIYQDQIPTSSSVGGPRIMSLHLTVVIFHDIPCTVALPSVPYRGPLLAKPTTRTKLPRTTATHNRDDLPPRHNRSVINSFGGMRASRASLPLSLKRCSTARAHVHVMAQRAPVVVQPTSFWQPHAASHNPTQCFYRLLLVFPPQKNLAEQTPHTEGILTIDKVACCPSHIVAKCHVC